MRRVSSWIAVVLGFLALSLPPGGVHPPRASAQESTTETALVYGINAAVPGGFVGTFTPAATGAIYLLAGQTSMIAPRMTQIYFWPITNEYRANWNTLNESVPGTLEITRNGSIVAELEPIDYTIHFTPAEGDAAAELFLGPEATSAEEEFRARQSAFQEASSAYRKAELEWINAVATVTARQEAGERVEPPTAPEMPGPIGVFSNGLNQGFPIALDPGHYQIRLRQPDGQTVPESEIDLVIFAPRRTGIGYTVVPETRWTTPLDSPSPSDIIVGAADSRIFLEPHQSREYPAREWALLNNPQQSAADAGGWQWVNGELLDTGELTVMGGESAARRLPLTPFTVRQLPGSQLGYEVVPFEPASDDLSAPETPDFEAFPIELHAAGEEFRVELVSADGEVLPGSDRLVSVPANPPLARLLLLPIVPLVIGAMAMGNRRRRVKLPPEAVT